MFTTRRYFLLKVFSEQPMSAEQLETTITNSVRKYFGEMGLARIKPKFIRFNSARSEAVVGCAKDGAEDFQAAIALISGKPTNRITPITLRVSGTIKGLRK
jgi:RNase P/RNase MRP subunit POP5